MIAIGNMAALPPVRALGVFTVSVGAMVLAAELIRSHPSVVLKIAGVSLFAAMSLALIYGIGRLVGVEVLTVSQMAVTHGLLNAVGFTLFGIIGHLRHSCDLTF